jgi:hypothetical protein
VQDQRAFGDHQIEAGLVFGRRALVLIQERAVHQFDEDAVASVTSIGKPLRLGLEEAEPLLIVDVDKSVVDKSAEIDAPMPQ